MLNHQYVQYTQYVHLHVCLYMCTWFIICAGSGKSQQEGDQTYDHKTDPVCSSSLLWEPICPIKKQLLADASSALFYGGAKGPKTQTCVFMHWKEGVENTWKNRPGVNPSAALPERFVNANVFVPRQGTCFPSSPCCLYNFSIYSSALILDISQQHVFAVLYHHMFSISERMMLILSGLPPRIFVSVFST